MKQFIIILVLLQVSLSGIGQIIVDHTVVDKFDKIPAYYLAEVKKMMVAFPGESHSAAYRTGMELLEALYPEYACNVSRGEAYTDQYVRVENWGWTGEYVWFTAGPSAYLKSEITSYNNTGHPFSTLGFGWCTDMTYGTGSSEIDSVFGVHWYGQSEGGPEGNLSWGLDAGDFLTTGNSVCLNTYFTVMDAYIAHCKTYSPSTHMVFTTGPVDSGWWFGENGYQGHIKHEAIRNYVKADPSRILFDYADILCYDDNGNLTTQTWNGHTFPSIAPDNGLPITTGHISNNGAIRVAKAQWWMLARIAGWDGIITDIPETKSNEGISVIVDNKSNEIRIFANDLFLAGQVSLYDLQGTLIAKKNIDNNECRFNKLTIPSGIYFVQATKSNLAATKKIIVID